jgi:hypothetical protein
MEENLNPERGVLGWGGIGVGTDGFEFLDSMSLSSFKLRKVCGVAVWGNSQMLVQITRLVREANRGERENGYLVDSTLREKVEREKK